MTNDATIFVQIAAYRDPECSPTLKDLFAKASNPKRVFAVVCWQSKMGEDAASPEIPKGFEKQVVIRKSGIMDSEGPSWAKRQVQQLYKGEDYVLMIDSHMRFVKNWDDEMIAELARCKSGKPVLSTLPPGYALPDNYDLAAKLSVVRAHYPTASGDIRIRGEQLDKVPPQPLRGAFLAPGFVFAKGALVTEVPYDPFLYFDQEEMCFSARVYTHGWDVFHPSKTFLFHMYDSTLTPFVKHKHWQDHPKWNEFNRRGRERRDHLLGVELASSLDALAELDTYGHGDARSLDEYAAFCGIHFAAREVTNRALTCGFIANLAKYRSAPLMAPVKPAASVPVAPQPAAKTEDKKMEPNTYTTAPAATGRQPRPSVYSLQAPNPFKPASKELLKKPIYVPSEVLMARAGGKANGPQPKIAEDAPPGVLVIDNYASEEVCKYLRDYADRTAGTQLKVVDNEKSTSGKLVTKVSEGRITEYVTINGVAPDMIGIFNDIYCDRLAPFYGVTFEWYERPQILRYPVGGKYNQHADAEHLNTATKTWMRSLDRDISVLLYLNENYEGGAIRLENFKYQIQPRTGMLLAFPSDHRYLHAALPTTKGIRYVVVSWAATVGSPRVKDSPPYASTLLHLPT